MTDSTRDEVQKLLQEDAQFSTRSGLRLVLSMLMEIDEKYQEQCTETKNILTRVGKLEETEKKLERKNILLWVENNTKTAVLVLFLFVLSVDVMVDSISSKVAIQTFLAALRKWAGLP
jgi:hypothetical protein